LIVAGGIGTIVAVSMVCVFLVWSVLPLFKSATTSPVADFKPPWSTPPIQFAVNEHGVAGWALSAEGELDFFRLDRAHEGQLVARRKLAETAKLTGVSTPSSEEQMAFGFDNGTICLGTVAFRNSFVPHREVGDDLRRLQIGEATTTADAIIERAAENQFRRHTLEVRLDEPVPVASAAVELVDVSWRASGAVVGSYADGQLQFSVLKQVRDPDGDKPAYKARTLTLPMSAAVEGQKPLALFVTGVGDNLFVAWKDGTLIRYDVQNLKKPLIAETIDLVPETGETLTAVQMLVGKATLVAGDSRGRVRGWFRVNKSAGEPGRAALVAAHLLPGPGSAVTALAPSPRSRVLAAGYADGRARLFYVTNDSLLAELPPRAEPVSLLAMYPRDNGLVAGSRTDLDLFALDIPHPEVSLYSLFMPVWYEGYDAPSHEWQSSGGTDNFEPKLGMTKVVFGTLKATVYSLLIGVPLALLAAIYTSEFLHKRARSRIKPTIELMASLPSVVLGFIAALVLAPIIERTLPTILVGIATVPLSLLAAAFGWQLLPKVWRARMNPWRFPAMCLTLPVGIWLFFSGDIMSWLSGRVGSGTGGWMLLLLPISALASAWTLANYVNPLLRSRSAEWGDARTAVVEMVKFVTATALCFVLALAVSSILTAAGFDPRGTFVGTYEQLNALVVGFVMGFAIIPIIYTIAEDALSTVPEHLRSASLGAGATPWQTAVRIIIPTAMSGLFSAVMIGLGRAVGETMIVLMAAGNTPVLDWNIFNGFRTLSGNIAEELPEAVKDSTHYRTLFLAALVLFALTFVLNTIAERVRQQFRKRAYQL
jgi:phosphate transport system permease protein